MRLRTPALAAVAGAGLLLLLHAPAAAQERPVVVPTRDVEVVYRAGPVEQRVRWLASGHKLRIDPPGAGVFMIVEYDAHRMEVVRPADRKAVVLPSPADLPGGPPGGLGGPDGAGSGVPYRRGGADTVAGQPCTDWTTRDNGGAEATVCFTADGVMLRAVRDGKVLVQAASVAYAPQDPAEFTVPPGFEVLRPPSPPPPGGGALPGAPRP